jgi:ADP-heptose:LPS heptosyltransferase
MLHNRKSILIKRLDKFMGIPLLFVFAIFRKLVKLTLIFTPENKGTKKILLIKLSALGDVVCLFPALYRLKRKFPDAEFTFLGGPSNRQIIEKLPFIKRFYEFNFKALTNIFLRRYDLVVDFEQWVRISALVSSLTLSKKTTGFKSLKQYRHFAFDHALNFNLEIHTAENFWNLSEIATSSGQQLFEVPQSLETFQSDMKQSRDYFIELLLKNRKIPPDLEVALQTPFIIIHPGCGEHGEFREWPLDSWKNLILNLKRFSPPINIFITGSGIREMAMAEELSKAGSTNLVEKINFNHLCFILERASEIYCGNTGVMHLASLLNDRLVLINGPTKLKLWKPLWGGKSISSPIACAPCLTWGHDYGCSDPVCLKIIRVEKVLQTHHAETVSALF